MEDKDPARTEALVVPSDVDLGDSMVEGVRRGGFNGQVIVAHTVADAIALVAEFGDKIALLLTSGSVDRVRRLGRIKPTCNDGITIAQAATQKGIQKVIIYSSVIPDHDEVVKMNEARADYIHRSFRSADVINIQNVVETFVHESEIA